jgi:hypothetical protein
MGLSRTQSMVLCSSASTDRIVKATQNLASTINGANPSQPDELAAIASLRALISNSSTKTPIESPPTVPSEVISPPEPVVQHYPAEPEPVFELQHPIQSLPTIAESHNPTAPALISQDEDDPIEPGSSQHHQLSD